MMQSTEQHKYLTDSDGVKTHVVLLLEEYEELMHQLLDARDAARMPELVAEAKTNGRRVNIEELAEQEGLKL